jgi:hypothetical protein
MEQIRHSTITISHPEMDDLKNCMNNVFPSLNKSFKANKPTLSFDKRDFMKFCTDSKTCFDLNMGYGNKRTEGTKSPLLPH